MTAQSIITDINAVVTTNCGEHHVVLSAEKVISEDDFCAKNKQNNLHFLTGFENKGENFIFYIGIFYKISFALFHLIQDRHFSQFRSSQTHLF